MLSSRLLLLSLFLLTSFRVLGADNDSLLQRALLSYKQGAYQETVNILKNINSETLNPTKYYWQGICFNKLQMFDDAKTAFKNALALKYSAIDLYYEYGQTLYALNELQEATHYFKRSYDAHYKEGPSLYYMAHIAQTLEEYTKAYDTYLMLIKGGYSEGGLDQIATFQVAEVLLEKLNTKEAPARYVEKYVLPMLKKALAINEQSSVATDIRTRIRELEDKYDLDPLRMRNGRKLTQKKYLLTLGQKLTYDNNVTLATDLPTNKSTEDDSYISETRVEGEYRFVVAKRVVIKPYMNFSLIRYENRENQQVYQNDSLTYAPQLKTALEHKLFSSPASLLLDLQYNKTLRDREKRHERIFFGRSTTLSLGEKFLYGFGLDATVKFKIKNYTSYTPLNNSETKTLSYSQLFPHLNDNLFLLIVNYDQTVVEDSLQNTNSYLFRADYIVPGFVTDKYTLTTGFGLTLLDTLAQSALRGTEKTLNPSVKLSHESSKNLTFSILYDYTKNISLDSDNYSYTKSSLAFDLEYSF